MNSLLQSAKLLKTLKINLLAQPANITKKYRQVNRKSVYFTIVCVNCMIYVYDKSI